MDRVKKRGPTMDDDSCSKFIGSLTKYLQSLCHSYVEFSNGVELVGHIYLHVDRGKKIDYVLNESVCKNGSNVVKFTSNSYHAGPMAERLEKSKEPPLKKAPDPSRSGLGGGDSSSRKRDDNDVIIVGSEAAKRRRASAPTSQMTSSQSQPSSGQSGGGGGGAGPPPSSSSAAGMFRHPRGPNPRMAAPSYPPGSRPGQGHFSYQARKRMPPPQQQQEHGGRGYLPMGGGGYTSRLRQPMLRSQGVPPMGVRGAYPVPSDVASIRGEYPPASGPPGMGGKPGDPRYQSPFHPRPGMPQLPMHQGHHPPQGAVGSQGRAPHLLGSSHLQTPLGSHLPGSMGPQGLMQPPMGPQPHGHHRFLPPYPLSSHGGRQAPSMSLPVTTQLTTSASHPSSTATVPTTSAVPTHTIAPPPTACSSSSSSYPSSSLSSSSSSAPGPATSTVMIKGRPVTIPASLASGGQGGMVPGQNEGGPQTRPQAPSSSASSSSSFHPSQSPGMSAGSGAASSSSSRFSSCQVAQPPRGKDGVKPLAALAASAGDSFQTSTSMASGVGVSSNLLAGISPKCRPSTPALEQCAAKKAPSPRMGGGPIHFPPGDSSSSSGGGQSAVPGLTNGPPFGVQTSAGIAPKGQGSASGMDHSSGKSTAQSPRAGGLAGYFRYPGVESGQSGGGSADNPYSSLSINIPPLAPTSRGGNHSLPSGGSSSLSPRVAGGSSYNSLSGMDLSHPLGGVSNMHSPHAGERSHPYRGDLPGGGGGSNLHSPRVGEHSHPYMGSNNMSHSSFNSSQLSPRMGHSGSLPYLGSSNMSHPAAVSASSLHSPRAGSGSLPYMGSSSNISHATSSAGDSHLYSPRGASYGSLPYMGSSHVSHVGDSNLLSPRGGGGGGGGERSHPYMGSSNISHPDSSNLRSPRGSDRGYPSYGDVSGMKLSHPAASASSMASPRAGDRSHAGSDCGDRNQLYSSMSGSSLPYSSGGAGSGVPFSSLTHNDPFPSVSGSNFPFTSLGDGDLPFPPPSLASGTGGDGGNPYPPVQNGRLPFPPLSGSSLPYPTFGDSNLPYSSVGGANLSSVSGSNLPPPLPGMGGEEGLGSQLTQERVRHSDNVFDMFGQPPHGDPLDPRFGQLGSDTDPLAAGSKPPTAAADPSSSFPLNLSQQAPFSLDQGVGGDGDGYSELVSELQALNQPPLNQDPTSPPPASPPGDARMSDPVGMALPSAEVYPPDGEAPREQMVNAPPRTSGYHGEEGDDDDEDPALPSDPDARTSEEEGQDEGHGETTPSCQASSQQPPVTPSEVPQTFLAPYEISGPPGAGSGGQGGGGGEEFREKRSGSVSSHSHETPSPSPGSVAGTEAVAAETKPQGQQASDYDSGCDSGSTSTGERLSSPQGGVVGQGQGQSSSAHPQLKSLTIPLVPVDSPNSSAKIYIKQERPSGEEEGEEGEADAMEGAAPPPPQPPPEKPVGAPPPPPPPVSSANWQKEVDPDWAADIAALNDSTESYSEGDDPDYVPENPRSSKGSVKRGRNKKSERGGRGKKRKVDSEEKGGEKEGKNSGKGSSQAAAEKGSSEAPPLDDGSSEHPEGKKSGDRYDPGMFLLLDTPSEPDRTGRIKASHTPAEVISIPEGEVEGLWVHTLVPAGHGLWRLPPDDHKCQVKVKVDPATILRTLYKVTVKIVAGKVLYKFDDM